MSTDTQVDIGSEFLGYQIEELIGRGGMGVVYRAYDLRLKRTVALKLVSPELALDQRFRERFSRETEVAMSLEHPNVVPVYDAGDARGRLYLAMRLVGGTDLRRLLATEGALDPSRAIAIGGQVASALDAAHAKGLVHRDVKPSNVLLDESEHVYLADFGLTRAFEEQGSQPGEGRSVGTPAYLAPEQIEAKPVDGRADVYALGCLLFECLTGETPYAQGSRLAMAWAHMEEEPPRASEHRPGLPQQVDSVISKAMAKEPDDRYTTCGAFLQAVAEALGLSRASRLGRRGLALLVVGVVVALAAILAAVLATRNTPSRPALFARPNTLARIDPGRNAVSDVIDVGQDPSELAIGGRSVWVYNYGDDTIWEIDAETRKVQQTTALHTVAADLGVFGGPVLAADAGGAWLVGGDVGFVLTRVRSDGGKQEYRLDHEPRAVAAGFGAVWVVGRRSRDNELIRIDPSTGRVTHRTRFRSTKIDSIGVGNNAVWVVGSASGMLYRVDPHSGRLTGRTHVGTHASRPAVWPGTVEIMTSDGGGRTNIIDPRRLEPVFVDPTCCPPQWGEDRAANGWQWWYDWPTASVYRERLAADEGPRQIRVASSTPQAGGPCLTSIALGAGAVWVTATPGPRC